MDPLSQVFCLRWNNHRNNLLTVLDHLLQTEAFCDVTLACDGASIKAHKMILSACSSYFQHLFMENTCEHPIVFLKDIKYDEIRAILDYMYKGEVNVAQEQLPGLLRVAELLKVKGLVEEDREKIFNSSGLKEPRASTESASSTEKRLNGQDLSKETPSTSSSSTSGLPPPPGLPLPSGMRSFMCTPPAGGPPFPWPALPGLLQGNLFNNRDKEAAGNNDYPNDKEGSPSPKESSSTGSSTPTGAAKRKKAASGSGGSNSSKDSGVLPEQSAQDDKIHSSDSLDKDNGLLGVGGGNNGGIANYVPNQRLEWKRYKQYTRSDIMAAIEEVKKGMSALQASRKYGVPSRTLYDKVKKLGITTGRQMQKKSLPQYPASFPGSMGGVS